MTKEKIDALLKALDRLDIGAEDRSTTHGLQSTESQSEAALMSVILSLVSATV